MDPTYGGPAQGIRNLDAAMRKMDFEREVVCLDEPDAAYLGKDNFKIFALGKSIGPWHYNKKLSSWLQQHIHRFDIVMINGLWLYTSYITWRVMKRLKQRNDGAKLPKLLVMPHGMLDPYFQQAKERKLKAIRNWIYWNLIECKVINDADGILFTCETELLLARKTFKYYYPKAEYNVGYGILRPAPLTQVMSKAFCKHFPQIEAEPYLLFLSRIHEKKGVDLLLRAYIDLYHEASGKSHVLPRLIVAGPGFDSQFGKQLQQIIKQSPEIKSRVIFIGMLSGPEKWGALYNCDALILPSHQENFGIVVAEALACSKPVLISNQVNIWREIEREGGGIVATDDYAGTVKLLKSWLALSDADKASMRQNALNVFEKHFNIDEVVTKYKSVFNSIAQG
jgi:glycosyltransferase involved in cell wall biosynthesis